MKTSKATAEGIRTAMALDYIKNHKAEIAAGTITVVFVGSAVYFVIKGEIVKAVFGLCMAVLSKELTAAGIALYKGASSATKTIIAKSQKVKECNIEAEF